MTDNSDKPEQPPKSNPEQVRYDFENSPVMPHRGEFIGE